MILDCRDARRLRFLSGCPRVSARRGPDGDCGGRGGKRCFMPKDPPYPLLKSRSR